MNIATVIVVLLGCAMICTGLWMMSPFIKFSIETIQKHKDIDKNKDYD